MSAAPASQAPQTADAADRRGRLYSTAEMAAIAGVTPRTVRFYESRGLLKPQRAGAIRVFNYADCARLALILRGKRLGFSLRDIGEYLDLYRADPGHVGQLKLVIDRTRKRIAELEGKLGDLQQSIRELREIEREALRRLDGRAAARQPGRPDTATETNPAKGATRRETML
ncbi:MAG: MerR family DNA-binding transcriptional regulator [Rhodospirillaceae bacterium]|nr:MerR family DNA-binding transcriptional regulator [Rhodospirillaceae bacterium]